MEADTTDARAPARAGEGRVKGPHLPEATSSDAAAPARRGSRAAWRDTLYRRTLAVADMLAAAIALTVSASLLGDDRLTLATLAVPPLFVVVVKAMGLYDRDEHLLHKTTLDEVPSLFAIATAATLLLALANDILIDGELGRRQLLGTWVLLFVLMVCLRAGARAIATRLSPVERCLFLGEPEAAEVLRRQLALSPAVKAELVGVVAGSGRSSESSHASLPEGLGAMLEEHQVERVIISSDAAVRDELLYTIRELRSYGIKVSVLPEASRIAGSSVELDHLHGITLMGMRRFEFTRSSRLVKRSFDVIGSALALALLLPMLVTIAVAIKLTSPGPVLFRQQRVGLHGRQFRMLKFRSMVDEAEQRKQELGALDEGADGLFKIPGDPRVTTLGRRLRRWQLDELPQLINVFRGEMSLVGPRPLIPEEDRRIEGWYRRRLDVPPGMTGHWQVLGSSRRIPLKEMVKLDYLYVANWSLWSDIKLLLRTVPFLVRRGGI